MRFIGDSAVKAVETNKRTVPADLVTLALGVRPNVDMDRSAGLKTGIIGAIAVDAYLKTSD